jgi:hypothetical protein
LSRENKSSPPQAAGMIYLAGKTEKSKMDEHVMA